MYSNYGEICVKIKELMEDFQKRSQSTTKVETIADMKAFVENYPQFKKMSGTVAKHVTLVGELSRLVATHNIMEVSEAEQQLACQEDHSEIVQVILKFQFLNFITIFYILKMKKIKNLIKDTRVKTSDILRLVCLYSLRYDKSTTTELTSLRELLIRRGGLTDQEREVYS